MRIACGHAPRCASIPGSSLGKVHVLGKGHIPSAADLPEAEAPGEGASQAGETGLAMRARVATLEEAWLSYLCPVSGLPLGPMSSKVTKTRSQCSGESDRSYCPSPCYAPLSPVLLPDPPKLLK